MKLILRRRWFTDTTTIGELRTPDGAFVCFTLEDVVRPKGAAKVYARTAIPAGVYSVIINESRRFKALMPLVQNVPGFSGIRIHPGNDHEDTEGCILVGRRRGPNMTIVESRLAYQSVFDRIQAAEKRGEVVELEIIDAPASDTRSAA